MRCESCELGAELSVTIEVKPMKRSINICRLCALKLFEGYDTMAGFIRAYFAHSNDPQSPSSISGKGRSA